MDRRNFLKQSASIGLGLSASIDKSHGQTTTTFSPVDAVKKLKVTSTSFANSFIIAPFGPAKWYFSNIGLLPFVNSSVMSPLISSYLDLYLSATEKSTYTIQDVQFSSFNSDGTVASNATAKPILQDSDDAYAGTLLSLVCRHEKYLNTQGKTWLNADKLYILKWIVINGIFNLEYQFNDSNGKTIGLTRTLIDSNRPYYNNKYLMDNCEVYKGLRDFANLLYSRGDMDYLGYVNTADRIRRGINYLYQIGLPQNSGFSPVFYSSTNNIPTTFSDGCAAQVFPQAFRVLDPSADQTAIINYNTQYDNSWYFLNYYFDTPTKKWINCNVDDQKTSSGNTPIVYPWMILGYVAAMRSNSSIYQQSAAGAAADKSRAQSQMSKLASMYSSNNLDPAISINEIAYYQRASDALNGVIY